MADAVEVLGAAACADLTTAGREFLRYIFDAFAPPADITVSEWAEAHRIIPRGNAEPGRWRNDRVPYAVEPMQAVTDDTVHTLVIVGCSQSSKTALAENIVGHAACVDPCTILWATPNDASAESAALRFDSIIAATPEMRQRFGSRTARSTTNNAGLKEFVGGKLVFGSAGSPTSPRLSPGPDRDRRRDRPLAGQPSQGRRSSRDHPRAHHDVQPRQVDFSEQPDARGGITHRSAGRRGRHARVELALRVWRRSRSRVGARLLDAEGAAGRGVHDAVLRPRAR